MFLKACFSSFVTTRGHKISIAEGYSPHQSQLTYDFILAPGFDRRTINLKVSGAAKLKPTGDGDLDIEIANVTVPQKRPTIYQRGDAARSGRGRGRILIR